MGDSDLSASELRRRYHRGGTVKDDELSSAQLRAKYAIPGNRKDFSTAEEEAQGKNGNAGLLIFAAVAVLVLLAVAAFLMLNK